LFFTDCKIPEEKFPNISFEQMGMEQLNDLASKKLGICIHKRISTQMDLQPAYGLIFEEFIEGYDFWGHCDVDVVWGDIRSFLTEDILQNYNILSFRKGYLAGHLTIWKNELETNTLFKAVPAYQTVFEDNEFHLFDEDLMSNFLKYLIENPGEKRKIRVYWPEQLVVGWRELEKNPHGWYWENGKIYDGNHQERVYIHFQKWKRSMKSIDFEVGDQPAKFQIARQGIWSRRRPIHISLNERLEGKELGNLFGNLKSSLRLLKMFLQVKDRYWARQLLANSINARDVEYDQKTGRLFLKRLNFTIGKQQHLGLINSYYSALQLVDLRGARFFLGDQEELLVDVAGFKAIIRRDKEIRVLDELLVEGVYNMPFSRPTVVWDIGLNVGLDSIFFASQHNAVVIGFEPFEKTYKQALRNISLNPSLSDKIHPFNFGISDANYKSTEPNYSSGENHFGPSESNGACNENFKFDYEQIELRDADDILESIVADYPNHDVVAKINCAGAEYGIITRLFMTGKLNLIDTVILKWHRQKPADAPSIIAGQLCDSGFRVFLFTPFNTVGGRLYAVRANSKNSIQGWS
jgi:FkbM family methyltransferase